VTHLKKKVTHRQTHILQILQSLPTKFD